MNFRSLFRSKTSRSRSRRRLEAAHLPAAFRSERLEDRALLAGNVTAQLRGQNAFFNGDNADNSVEILVEDGNVVARGNDSTTINGSADDFILAANTTSLPASLIASLSRGNDTFVVNGVNTGGSVWMNGASGNDLLVVSNANIGGNLVMRGGSGSDDLVVDESQISGDVKLFGAGGNDDFVLRNTSIGDDLLAAGGRGRDVFMFDTVTVSDRTWLFGQSGTDNFRFEGVSQYSDRVRAVGGRGGDNFDATADVSFNRLKRRRFDGSAVDASLLETRITNAQTGALARAEAAVAADSALSISVDNAIFSETAGNSAATLTITRDADNTDADLTVTLATTPTGQSKISLAATTVTIAAGETSTTVAVDALDDAVIDSDTTITVTASSPDLPDATVDITVTNDDTVMLTLTAASTSFDEDTGSGSTIGEGVVIPITVSRNGDATDELEVSLSTPDTGRLLLPSSVSIAAGQTEVTFNVTTRPDTNVDAEDVPVTVDAAATGAESGQIQFTLVDNDEPFLAVSFSDTSISENNSTDAGRTTLTVTRNTPTTEAVVVSFSTNPTSPENRLALSSTTVTIPVGQRSATVTVSGVDNSTVDIDQAVAVTATAQGFIQDSETIFVTDDDAGELSLTLTPASVDEDAGVAAVTARVSRNVSSPTQSLVVSISVSGDARLSDAGNTSIPTSVTIPANQQFVEFTFGAADNNVIDATGQTATLTASATGFVSSAANITVNEDDVATLALTSSLTTVAEDAGQAAISLTVSRNTTATSETIALDYSQTSISGPATVVFAVGQSERIVTVDVNDNDSFLENSDVTITASAPGRADVTTNIVVTNDDSLGLTTDVSSNVFVASVPIAEGRNESLITRDSSFTVTGFTAAGATVQIESDGDGRFDEQSVMAAGDGSYSFDIPLTNTDVNNGLQAFQVRSVIPGEGVQRISDPIDVHLAVGTIVRFETNQDTDLNGVIDFFDVELFDADASETVDNFVSYVDDGSYDDMFVHRVTTQGITVVQGGSFTVSDTIVSPVATRAPIDGQFTAANSNIAGTLSMALTGAGPNSGTSGWFFNVTDNVGLDANEHTVFGRLVTGGLGVVASISTTSTADLRDIVGQQGLLGTTPLRNPPFQALTGTAAVTADSNVIVGTGTQFTTELQVGDAIGASIGQAVFVTSIVSDTEITVDLEADGTQSDLTLGLLTPPDDDYIIFTNIGELLDQI